MTYTLEEIEKSFLRAFPFPPVLYKVVSMIKEEAESLYKLGQEIAKDPVLSASVLARANSPFFGTRGKISDLPHAISLLGYNEVSMSVLRFIAKGVFDSSKEAQNSRLYFPEHIWRHSIKVAHICRILMRKHKIPFMLEGYMAGLMHDIGKNAIAISIRNRDEQKILDGLESGKKLYQLEKKVLGFSHAQCSFQILNQMNLSPDMLKMIRCHHQSMAIDFSNPSFVMALANVLSYFDNLERKDELDMLLVSQFGMVANDIPELDKIYIELKIDMEFI
jgi:putative nucleotidyltransferase with HDIG domain